MAEAVAIDTREITVTPVFRMMEIENIPKSETAGHLVKELREVVQVRFAGSNNYSPIFPADGFWKREGNQVITYAERWSDQYRQFKEGNPQEAMGTPLEMLRPYGITPEQLSLCRTMKVYSIEALDALEGQNLKNLGMNANRLKDIARKYMEERRGGSEALKEIEELKRQIAALTAKSTLVPDNEPSPPEIEASVSEADELEFKNMTDADIRDYLEQHTGVKPDGRLGRDKLINMARGV